MFQAEMVEQLLIQCARIGVDICYSEALMALGCRFSMPKMRELCQVLGEVEKSLREP